MTNEAQLLQLIQESCPSPAAPLGIGDDCAIIPNHAYDHVLKVDSVIEGVHFTLDTPGELIGKKAINRVISDFSAMGGASPTAFLVSITLDSNHTTSLIHSIYQGIAQVLQTHGGELVGGETSHYKKQPSSRNTPNPCTLPLNISVTGLASIPSQRVISRNGAKPGQAIFVTGNLGYSLESNHHLDFEPRLEQGQWLANQAYATAMMDLSDGLAMDLPRLCQQSNCHYQLDLASIPCVSGSNTQQALSLGEDYELLFTVESEKVTQLLENWQQKFPDLALTQIGSIINTDIASSPDLTGGWDCFN